MKKTTYYVLACFMLAFTPPVWSQGTAFSYQGRLQEKGVAANGNYDFRFAVFDAAQGAGAQQGPTVSLDNVVVAQGQFRVLLDFGVGVFTGGNRWLEISVRKSGVAGAPVVLSPRQPLLPVPYAIHASTAGSVGDGAITEAKLAANSVSPGRLQDKAVTAAKIAEGNVVKSLNGLRDEISLTAGPNVTITPNGNSLIIAATGGAGGSSLWTLNGVNAYYNGGSVGIGTTTPTHRLSISGGPAWTGHAWGGAVELDNASAIAWNANASGNHFGIGQTTDGLFVFSTPSNPGTGGIPPNYRMVIDNAGNVGIGTPWGDTLLSKLSIYEPTAGYGIRYTDGKVGVGAYINADGGWLGTSSKDKLHFFVNGGRDSSIIGLAAVEPPILLQRTPSMTIDTAGNVGIGTDSPAPNIKLEVRSIDGHAVFGRSGFEGIHGESTSATAAAVAGFNLKTGPGIYGESRGGGYGGYFVGRVRVGVLEVAGGADLAEPFPMTSDNLRPGTIVVIDEDHPGQLMRSEHAYDSRVAGVISGANGINPGLTLHQEGAFANGQKVALTGRVYALADATDGTIKPGDLLTTSETPGHAMKASDPTKAQGAILGKAMSPLTHGRGMILVLVTLQ